MPNEVITRRFFETFQLNYACSDVDSRSKCCCELSRLQTLIRCYLNGIKKILEEKDGEIIGWTRLENEQVDMSLSVGYSALSDEVKQSRKSV